jgi:D-xylose transport system substrate-binding protein
VTSPTRPVPVNEPPVIGVLLPERTGGAEAGTPARDPWDRRNLEQAFAARGLGVDIRSVAASSPDTESDGVAGEPNGYAIRATELIRSGIRALVLPSPSDGSAAAIATARAAGVPVIELDHLTTGAEADYYVGPDPRALGQILGEGLLRCLSDGGPDSGSVALLNGPSSDPIAAVIKQQSLAALVRAGRPVRISLDLPGWRIPGSGLPPSALMQDGTMGVIAASDAIAAAASARKPGQLVGVGSSPEALLRVLNGSQCMTVLTSPRAQADAAALLASDIVTADPDGIAGLAGQVIVDPATGRSVPSVLLQPQPVFATDLAAVVDAGLVSAADLCQSARPACARLGIQVS